MHVHDAVGVREAVELPKEAAKAFGVDKGHHVVEHDKVKGRVGRFQLKVGKVPLENVGLVGKVVLGKLDPTGHHLNAHHFAQLPVLFFVHLPHRLQHNAGTGTQFQNGPTGLEDVVAQIITNGQVLTNRLVCLHLPHLGSEFGGRLVRRHNFLQGFLLRRCHGSALLNLVELNLGIENFGWKGRVVGVVVDHVLVGLCCRVGLWRRTL